MSPHDEHLPKTERELRSFGRRKGRPPSQRQQRLLEELLPRLRVPVERGWRSADEFALFFGGPIGDLWLEIGFGGGEHLVWQAEHNPEVTIIGCEPFEDGVVKVLTAVEERGLRNIRIYADDARTLLRWLPPASIDRAFVLFPDPWPKRKHVKRRLLSEATFTMLSRVVRPGGELRIATDIADYARTLLLAAIRQGDFEWTAQCAPDWRRRPADWPSTRYEQKAQREGRRCAYLSFRRRSATGRKTA